MTGGVGLTIEEARDAAWAVFEDTIEAQIGALLATLRVKDETEAEIAGSAQGMYDAALTVEPDRGPLVDTHGTGGDDYNIINVSTANALAVVGAGATVAKHGNYSASSSSGSADVLEVAGVNVEAGPEFVETCIEDNDVGFTLAPVFHPVMKAIIGPRKELGMWTAFNILGPLTNPTRVDVQVSGVYDAGLIPVIAEPLSYMPAERVLVVHGSGMDEIALHDTTTVVEIDGDEITEYTLTPVDLDLGRAPIEAVAGGTPQENADDLEGILTGGVTGPKRDLILVNTGATIYVAGLADSLEGGTEVARDAINSGVAKAKHDAPREA